MKIIINTKQKNVDKETFNEIQKLRKTIFELETSLNEVIESNNNIINNSLEEAVKNLCEN